MGWTPEELQTLAELKILAYNWNVIDFPVFEKVLPGGNLLWQKRHLAAPKMLPPPPVGPSRIVVPKLFGPAH